MGVQDWFNGGFIGRVGQLVGQHWHNKRIVRTYVIGADPNTPAQQASRQNFALCLKHAQLGLTLSGHLGLYDTTSMTECNRRVSLARAAYKAGGGEWEAVTLAQAVDDITADGIVAYTVDPATGQYIIHAYGTQSQLTTTGWAIIRLEYTPTGGGVAVADLRVTLTRNATYKCLMSAAQQPPPGWAAYTGRVKLVAISAWSQGSSAPTWHTPQSTRPAINRLGLDIADAYAATLLQLKAATTAGAAVMWGYLNAYGQLDLTSQNFEDVEFLPYKITPNYPDIDLVATQDSPGYAYNVLWQCTSPALGNNIDVMWVSVSYNYSTQQHIVDIGTGYAAYDAGSGGYFAPMLLPVRESDMDYISYKLTIVPQGTKESDPNWQYGGENYLLK